MSHLLDYVFLFYFLGYNGINSILMTLAVAEIIRRGAARLPELDTMALSAESTPPVTIIAPAYNEEATIVSSTRAFLQLEYPSLSVIVVNDGSKDRTLSLLKETFDLVPVNQIIRRQLETQPILGVYRSKVDDRLLVIDKANGGKADALNVGLNAARTPLVCCVDSDTLIDRKALLRMIEPLVYDDRNAVAVGGTVRLANGCTVRDGQVLRQALPKSWLARVQLVEYLRAFLFGRMGWNWMGGNVIISGAFGLFHRDTVVEVGGYQPSTVGEDMELVLRIHHVMSQRGRRYRVVQIPEPVCYTEAPENWSILSRQRDRWQRGLLESIWMHKSMLFRPKYGVVGMLVLPIFLIFEAIGPVIELGGYLWFGINLLLGTADPKFAVMFTLSALFWGFLLSVQSLVLDDLNTNIYRGIRVRLGLLLAALLENVGYRQMTLYYRLKGTIKYLAGEKAWGRMKRKGFQEGSAP